MLTYEQALEQVLRSANPTEAIRIPIADTLGMVVAIGVGASTAIPPFTASAMDGFAARYTDFVSGTPLTINGMVRAGDMGHKTIVVEGQACKILTGAQLPPFVDTVVPIEDCTVDGDLVTITAAVRPNQCVRPAGQDVTQGSMVLNAGQIVTPAGIAICAASGVSHIHVHRRPKVSVIATGNELTPPGKFLDVGKIYNSNSFAIAAQVAEAGGIVDKVLHAVDDPDSILAAFDQCAESDIIISSGGVSVGEFDYVKDIFEERGTLGFWKVAIRPGKPLAFGRWENKIFFGLPGNPVSSMVTFELFARPLLRKMLGDVKPTRPIVDAIVDEDLEHGAGRRSFVRGVARREGVGYGVKQSGGQDSGMLHAMVAANCFIIVSEDVSVVKTGSVVKAMIIDPGAL